MSKAKIGAVIALDGEKEFKSAVSNVNTELKSLKSEANLVQEQFKGQANTIEALQAKHNALSKVVEKQKEKQDALQKSLDHAKESQARVGLGLEELRSKLQSAKDKMEEMQSSSSATTEEMEAQQKEMKDLSEAIERGERNYQTATNWVYNWQTSLNRAQTELLSMNHELNQTDQYMEEANRSTNRCASSIDEMGNHIRQTESDTNHLAVAVDTALGTVFANAIENAFGQIVDLSKQAVTSIYEVGSSFDSEMSKVEALSGATDQMDELSAKAKEIGAASKFTATQAGEGFEYMALAGWDAQEMLDGIDGVISATAASGLELSQVSDILTDSITAFGDSAADANRYADVLATTQAKSNTTIAALGEAFTNVASTCGSYGYSLESASAALGDMANAGIKGGSAGTQLSIIMTRLATNTNGARDQLSDLGVEFYNSDGSARDFNDVITELCDATANMTTEEKASVVTKLAGKNAQKGLNAILNQGSEAYNDLYDKLMNCDGAAQQMADTMNENLAGKMTIMQSSLEAVGLSIYEHFKEPLKEAVESGTNGINELNNEVKNGPLSDSLDDLGEKTGELAEKAIDFAVKAVPKVTNGLSWIIDHGDEITSILKGIGAGLATMAAVNGISKAVTVMGDVKRAVMGITTTMRTMTTARQAATVAQEAETVATEAATAAQTGLNAAQKANAIGLIISLVTMLGTAVYSYVKATNDEANAQDKLFSKLEKEQEIRNQTNESIKSSIQASKDSIESTSTEWDGVQKLSDRLFELNKVQGKTKDQKTEMKAIVEELSESIPELADAYNVETGAMSITKDEIDKLIKKRKEYAMAVASQDTLLDLAQSVSKSEAQIKQTKDSLKELKKEYKEFTGVKYGETHIPLSINIAQARKWKKLSGEIKETEEELKEYEKVNEDASAQMEIANKNIEKYSDSINDATTSIDFFSAAQTNSAEITTEMTDEQIEAYEELQKSIKESVDNCISAFEEFNGGTEISAEDIKHNLQTQIDGISQWKENMKLLAQQAGSGMSEEFYSYLQEMGPESANLVQTLVDSLNNKDGDFEEICKQWSEAMDLENTVANDLADASEEVSSGIDHMSYEAEQKSNEMYDKIATAFDNAANKMKDSGSVMNGTLQGQWNLAIATAKENGVQIPQELADGIENGSIKPIDAITQINELINQKTQGQLPTMNANGQQYSSSMASGILAGKDGVATATGTAAQVGVDAGNAKRGDFETVGKNLALGMRDGMIGQVGALEAEGANMADFAKNGAIFAAVIRSPSHVWRDEIGAMMGKGLALGIRDEKENVNNSVKSLMTGAVNAAGDTDGKKAGRNLSETLTKGITANVSQSVTKVKNLYADFIKSMVSHLKQKKANFTLSLEQEKKYWKEIASMAKTGSAEWKNAIKKATNIDNWEKNMKAKISSAFNISEYTTNSKGEQEKKSAKDYYSEIYQAAAQYFENYSTVHNVSLRQEEYYWQQVVKKLKKGTQAYYDAVKQLNQVKQKIADAKTEAKESAAQEKQEKKDYGVSGGALDAYKTYYEVSAKAEAEYWNTVRKQYKKGTKERLEADQKYYEAKENLNNQLEELNQEYAENVKTVNADLKENIQELTDAYNDAVEERKDAIYSSFNLFDQFESTSESGEKLLYNLKTQVAGYADWEQQLEELSGKGTLDTGLLDELKAMGPEASASIHALNNLTAEQLAEYNKLWKEKNALSESQAVKDNEALRKQTQTEIDALKANAKTEIAALKETYKEAITELKKPMDKALKNLASKASTIGEEAALKLISGLTKGVTKKSTAAELEKVNTAISSKLGKLPKAGKTIGDQTLQGILDGLTNKKKMDASAQAMIEALKKSLQDAADIHSPSRLFKKEVGVQISAGVAEGITDESGTVNNAGTDMLKGLLAEQQAKVAAQRAQLDEYVATMIPKVNINGMLEARSSTVINQNLSTENLATTMTEMLSMMQEYMPQIGQAQITMDTGALVGETSSTMSQELAMRSRRMRK